MSLATLANLVRRKPVLPITDSSRLTKPVAGGLRSLLAREERPAGPPAATVGPRVERQTLVLGIDFGAHETRLIAAVPGVEEYYLRRSIPSVVASQLPEDEQTLSPFLYFGVDALNKGPRFQKFLPWQDGDIADPLMARELARHLRDLMRRSEVLLCRAVVAEPITMSAEGRHHLRQALRGLFDQVVFLPRPYLAGVGLRQHLRQNPPAIEGSGQALLVDLGAGSTEAGRVGARYPGASDMVGQAFGGRQVEQLVREALRQEYPAFRPDASQIRDWLENFGFVGEPVSTVAVKIVVDGVERDIVLTNSLRRAGEAWLAQAQQLIETLLEQGGEAAERPTKIYLTGGGSRLNRLAPVLATRLARNGFEGLAVEVVEPGELSFTTVGALHAARQVRDDQWPRFALT
jgi:actin-like ATPase involved in cell morphogenesis